MVLEDREDRKDRKEKRNEGSSVGLLGHDLGVDRTALRIAGQTVAKEKENKEAMVTLTAVR